MRKHELQLTNSELGIGNGKGGRAVRPYYAIPYSRFTIPGLERLEPMIPFSFETNSEAVLRALDNYQESLEDNSDALAAVAGDLRQMVADQFATEGTAGGTPWAPLAPSTLRKSRRTRSGILNLTGALLGSLTDPGASGHVEETDGSQLLFGSALAYAGFHQTGTRRMPARPIIVLSDDSTARWLEIVRAQIEEKALLLEAQQLGGRKS
jgi:phage gpG-like protein